MELISGGRRCQAVRKATGWESIARDAHHPARSKTPDMPGNSMRENREPPAAPTAGETGGRRENAMSDESFMHAAGGKAVDQGEHRRGQPEPDAESGDRVTGPPRCAGSSEEGQGATVHRPAASGDRRTAPGQLLRVTAASRAGSGSSDMAAV